MYTLAKKWKIGFSGTSAADNLPEPRPIEAGLDELDYALLRLESAPGEERGIIEVPHELPALEAPMALCCIQYPIDSAQCFAFSPDGLQQVNAQRTRFTHRVNTKDASSGSPIFDMNLQSSGFTAAG